MVCVHTARHGVGGGGAAPRMQANAASSGLGCRRASTALAQLSHHRRGAAVIRSFQKKKKKRTQKFVKLQVVPPPRVKCNQDQRTSVQVYGKSDALTCYTPLVLTVVVVVLPKIIV